MWWTAEVVVMVQASKTRHEVLFLFFSTSSTNWNNRSQVKKINLLLNVNVHLHVGIWTSWPDVEGVLTHHPQDSRASKRSTALDLTCQIILIRWSSSRYSPSLSCWFKGSSFVSFSKWFWLWAVIPRVFLYTASWYIIRPCLSVCSWYLILCVDHE